MPGPPPTPPASYLPVCQHSRRICCDSKSTCCSIHIPRPLLTLSLIRPFRIPTCSPPARGVPSASNRLVSLQPLSHAVIPNPQPQPALRPKSLRTAQRRLGLSILYTLSASAAFRRPLLRCACSCLFFLSSLYHNHETVRSGSLWDQYPQADAGDQVGGLALGNKLFLC